MQGNLEFKTKIFLDERIYYSLEVTDNNGNDVQLSCWFCDSDKFSKAATKHLMVVENPN